MKLLQPLSLITLVLFCSAAARGQCGITVDAGPDRVICAGQGGVTLSGSVSGGAFGFAWEPNPTLDNTRSLTPTVNPTTRTEYVLVGYTANPADNLVVNGDFEQGNVGFDSEYDFEPGGIYGAISTDGSYSITDNSNDAHSLFNPCADNSGSGNMMACNGSTQPNLKVWCQTVNITPNTDYVLRAYIASIWNIGAAELQFSVNDDLVGPIFRPTLTPPCTYDFFDERWRSGPGETTAEICVVNQTTLFVGYNFALDDIFFAPVCEQYDEVIVDFADTDLALDATFDLPCSVDVAGLPITATGNTAPGYTYQWATTDGNIVSGGDSPTVFVDAAGNYTVTLSFSDGVTTCSDTRTIEVRQDELPPQLLLESDFDLDCFNERTVITSVNSVVSPGSTYRWTTSDGNIISSATAEFITVDAGGTYTLEVISGSCTDSEDFVVLEDFTTPTASIAPPPDLSCDLPEVILDGSGTVLGPDDFFFWTTTDGEFIGGTNTLRPSIVRPGAYQLVVENSRTSCFSEVEVIVGGSGDPTVALINDPPLINCQGDPVTLTAFGSTDTPGTVYAWSTTNGALVGPTDGLAVRVAAAGTYELEVTEANGCQDRRSVTVLQEGFNPDIAISATPPLTCDRAQTTIVASVPTTETVTYEWSTTDGQIVSGADSLAPVVAAAGTYRLEVTEPGSGCSINATVTVSANLVAPALNVADGATITCSSPSVPLAVRGDTADLVIGWQDAAGNPVSGQTLEPGWFALTALDTTNGCTTLDTLTVAIDTTPPPAEPLAAATVLTCTQDSLELTAADPLVGVDYRWVGPEGTVSGAEVTVATPGTYVLTATARVSGCVAADSLTLARDQELPRLSVGASPPLTCERSQIELVGAVENPGGFVARWSTTGNIVSGASTLRPSVDAPGDYQLTLFNPTTGCADSTTVIVVANRTAPVAAIARPDTLTCRSETSLLDGGASTLGDSISYRWQALSGNLTGPADAPLARAAAAGTYQLTVRNQNTGCSTNAVVAVAENGDRPVVDLGDTVTLNCLQPAFTLNEGDVPAPALRYDWRLATGPNQVADQPSLTVTRAGRYLLRVENLDNGCVTTDSVEVTVDTLQPIVSIAPVGDFNCTVPVLTLEGSATATRGATFYWSTLDGNFSQDDVANQRGIEEPGTYTLRVENANGCSGVDRVTVGIDTLRPTLTLPTVAPLTCRTPRQTLTALAESGQGAGLRYSWSAENGTGLGDGATLEVATAGRYSLRVTNERNNCERSATINVAIDTIRPELAELPEAITLTCDQPEVTLNEGAAIEAGFTYRWARATSSIPVTDVPTLRVRAADRYTLRVENTANGCAVATAVEVSVDTLHPEAVIAPAGELNCTVTELTLDGSASESRNPTYRWSLADGTSVVAGATDRLAVNEAGVYQLEITNANGCTDAATVRVGIDTVRPTVVLPPVEALSCRDPERTLVATVGQGQGPDLRLAWSAQDGSPLGGAPEITVAEAGRYTLLVVNDDNGCQRSAVLDLGVDTLRPVLAGLPTATLDCRVLSTRPEPTLLGGRAEVDYRWRSVAGPDFSAAEARPLVTSGGRLLLTVTDPINGCTDTEEWTVRQDTVSPRVSLPAELDLGCDTLPVVLAATTDATGYAFAWSTQTGTVLNGSTTAQVRLQGPGRYQLAVENPRNGCRTSREIALTQTLLEGFVVDLAAPNCLRPSGELTFSNIAGGIGPFLYSIDGGRTYSADAIYRELAPDRYELSVQDVRGCEVTQTVNVPPVRLLEIGLTEDFTLRMGDSARLVLVTNFAAEELDTIAWSTAPGLNCYDCADPVARPLTSTSYEVLVRSNDGCLARTRVQVEVDERALVYVPNAFSPNGDGVNDLLAPLAAPHRVNRVLRFEVADRWGNQLYEATDLPLDATGGGWDGTLRGQPLNPGVRVWWAEVELVDRRIVLLKGEVQVMR